MECGFNCLNCCISSNKTAVITLWGKNHCSTKTSIKDHPSDESGFLKSGIPLPGPHVVLRVTVISIWGACGLEKRCLCHRGRAQDCLIDFSLFPQIHSSSYSKLLSKTNSFHISIIPRHRKGVGLAAGAFRVPIH